LEQQFLIIAETLFDPLFFQPNWFFKFKFWVYFVSFALPTQVLMDNIQILYIRRNHLGLVILDMEKVVYGILITFGLLSEDVCVDVDVPFIVSRKLFPR